MSVLRFKASVFALLVLALAATSGYSAGQGTSVKEILGLHVLDPQGHYIGDVQDIVLDLHEHQVKSVVIEGASATGNGKVYSVPMRDLKLDAAQHRLSLLVGADKLKDMQGRTHSGSASATAGATTRPGQGGILGVDTMIGMGVTDRTGKGAGTVKDVRIDPQSGRIDNVVLELMGGGRATVQAKSISFDPKQKLVIDKKREQLQKSTP